MLQNLHSPAGSPLRRSLSEPLQPHVERTAATGSPVAPSPVTMMVRVLLDGLLSVLLAPVCASCRQPLDSPLRSAVCGPCWGSIAPPAPPLCRVCGNPAEDDTEHRCARGRAAPGPLTTVGALGDYAGALRDILHSFKYDGRRSIGSDLAQLLRARCAPVLSGADIAVPVPLHWRRQWQRGFNQAAILAAGLGLPVVHALRRARNTPTQTDLPAAERRANVRGAFHVRRRAPIAGARVVLVDDVSTTGATLEACARALLRGGAREVRGLTAARVVTTRQTTRRP